jgi:hypothetical protein
MPIFNTEYKSYWEWKPWANTLAYFPFREDQLDHSWKIWVSLTTSWTKETLWYSFTDNTLITGASQFYWFSCWVKLDSASNSWVIGTFTSYNNMWWYIYDSWLYPAITSFYTSSYSRANQRFDNPEQRHLLWVWYDGTNTIYWINWTYWILRNWAWYNFWSWVDLFTKWWNATWKVTYSDFIAESKCWSVDEYINYYNSTKSNYWL